MRARYFATPAKFREWLEKNHASAAELWVGFHKVHTGKPSITWPQSVDEALCFGWIDGLRRGLGESAYMIRFSPRRPGSIWSNVNTKRVGELRKLGLVRAAGIAAFERRDPARSIYIEAARHSMRRGKSPSGRIAPRGSTSARNRPVIGARPRAG